MKTRGSRFFYDEKGNILFQFGEAKSDSDSLLPFPKIEKINYMDLDYGFIDFNTHYIESIDVETDKPIIKQYEVIVSDEILKREQLERENAELAYQLMIGGN